MTSHGDGGVFVDRAFEPDGQRAVGGAGEQLVHFVERGFGGVGQGGGRADDVAFIIGAVARAGVGVGGGRALGRAEGSVPVSFLDFFTSSTYLRQH